MNNIEVDLHISNQNIEVTKTVVIDHIAAPLDLDPNKSEVTFEAQDINQGTDEIIISVDPDNSITEITEINKNIVLKKDDIVSRLKSLEKKSGFLV